MSSRGGTTHCYKKSGNVHTYRHWHYTLLLTELHCTLPPMEWQSTLLTTEEHSTQLPTQRQCTGPPMKWHCTLKQTEWQCALTKIGNNRIYRFISKIAKTWTILSKCCATLWNVKQKKYNVTWDRTCKRADVHLFPKLSWNWENV